MKGEKFSMLEALERIIDSGYGESGNGGEEELKEERKIKVQHLKNAADSMIESGKEAKALIGDGKDEDAFSMLSGGCGIVVQKLAASLNDNSILTANDKMMAVIDGALLRLR